MGAYNVVILRRMEDVCMGEIVRHIGIDKNVWKICYIRLSYKISTLEGNVKMC